MARVLISMPEQFLTQIDSVAQGENRTRSELIREALRTYINRSKIRENGFWIAISFNFLLDFSIKG